MTMADQQAYPKTLFFVAALYNWGAALLFMGLYFLDKELLALFIKIPDGTLWYFVTSMAIALFGLGYFFIYKDIKRNRDIIKLGSIGKTLFFLLFLIYWQKGDITGLTFSLACGDLIFALLFAHVLYSLKNSQPISAELKTSPQ
jgi:hypothetical protein